MTAYQTYTILVVDDDDIYREDIHRMLDGAYTLIDTATGWEAIEKVELNTIHCVLLDYRLPDWSGLELLSKFTAKGIPVVMMTAEGSEQIAVEAMKQGALDYLVKSTFTENLLRTAITKAIERAALVQTVRQQQEELAMFTSIASHDLRAPLRTISGFVKIIREELESSDNKKLVDYCQRVTNGVDRMSRLIEGLLRYTRQGRGLESFESIALNDVAKEVGLGIGGHDRGQRRQDRG